jgi:hypothetical protein
MDRPMQHGVVIDLSALEEPAVFRSFADKSMLPINPRFTSLEEADDQPLAVDYSHLLVEQVVSTPCAERAEKVAASASNTATMAREQVGNLSQYLEERRAAAESQRLVAESRRAQVRAQFPRTPKCVKFGKHSRGGMLAR